MWYVIIAENSSSIILVFWQLSEWQQEVDLVQEAETPFGLLFGSLGSSSLVGLLQASVLAGTFSYSLSQFALMDSQYEIELRN